MEYNTGRDFLAKSATPPEWLIASADTASNGAPRTVAALDTRAIGLPGADRLL